MSAHLARRGSLFRLVAEEKGTEGEHGGALAAEIVGQGIVVAGDPDEGAAGLDAPDFVTERIGHALARPAVVQAVTQRDHHARTMQGDGGGEALQRVEGIIGRQHLAAPREGGAFLEVEVRHNHQPLVRPEQGTGGVKLQLRPAEVDPREGEVR